MTQLRALAVFNRTAPNVVYVCRFPKHSVDGIHSLQRKSARYHSEDKVVAIDVPVQCGPHMQLLGVCGGNHIW